jgi:UDP-N-acetylmuramyl pentapeptide phosphotransferase/UDP-N-acetylglucosamine-1-phosphate transferase
MLVTASLSFGIAFGLLVILVSRPVRNLVVDRPNERSLHAVPMPRTGGLAIVAGVAGSLAFAGSREQGTLLIALALAAISFGDDLFGLPTLLRFVAHMAAAVGILALTVPHADPIVFLLLFLAIAWLTNLFNFMDGSDGLAGGMAVVGFGAYAFAAHIDGVAWLAATCIAVASAALAFLLFNFPPAKIFMGDSGSIPLGFMAGAIGVAGWQAGVWSLWFPVLVFSPFAVDATLTLGKRVLRGDKVWEAHREHYYQRLVRMGFGHRNTALAEYLLMASCAGIALAVRNAPFALQIALMGTCAAGYAGLALWIDSRWSRHRANKPDGPLQN